MTPIEETQKQEIIAKIAALELKHDAAIDFEERVDIKGQIHNLKMILEGTKPYSSIEISCDNCGS